MSPILDLTPAVIAVHDSPKKREFTSIPVLGGATPLAPTADLGAVRAI